MENLLTRCRIGEFVDADVVSTQDEGLVGWDALAHYEYVEAGCAGCMAGKHGDSDPYGRFVLVRDGVPAMKAAVVTVPAVMCPDPRLVVVLKAAGGGLRAP